MYKREVVIRGYTFQIYHLAMAWWNAICRELDWHHNDYCIEAIMEAIEKVAPK